MSEDAAAFWPSDMLAAYKDIAFTADGDYVSIAINAYRNNDAKAHPNVAGGGTQDALKVKDALMSIDMKGILGRIGTLNYVDVFTGKGSVASIREVMRSFVDYSPAFIKKFSKTPGPAGKTAALLADQSLSWQDTLQQISTAYLGLDCNGFVGNWIKLVQPDFRLGPQNGPGQFKAKAKTIRKRVQDIEYWDILIFQGNIHIAVVEEPGAGLPKFSVCQSAGGGPRKNEYSFLNNSAGTFVLGGTQKGDIGHAFEVISLW